MELDGWLALGARLGSWRRLMKLEKGSAWTSEAVVSR